MGAAMNKELESLRKEIAEIDVKIIELAHRRLMIAKKIGEVKKRSGLAIFNPEVEAEVISRAETASKRLGLNPKFAKRLTSLLIDEAVKLQMGPYRERASYLYSIFEKAMAMEAHGEKIVRLDVGEPDLNSPEPAIEAIYNSLNSNRHVGYSSSKGIRTLREAICNKLNERYGADLDSEQVLITPGGKFAIFAAIIALLSQGDRAIIPTPTWPVYGSVVQLVGGREDSLNTRFEEHWELDLCRLAELFRLDPKLLILCTPNNPTGKVFSSKTLREITNMAEATGTHILVDEVYEAYTYTSFKSILQVASSNFIYVNTFSKRYGMTGWRIGYAVSDKETIEKMQKIVQLSVTCVPEFIQKAALAALSIDQEPYEKFAINMKARVELACKELNALPLECHRPDGGMYLFPRARIDGFDSDVFAARLLDEEKVAITPGMAFGDYPEHFRISLGTGEEEIKKGITGIGRVLDRWIK
jgi:aspartate aminotransferase